MVHKINTDPESSSSPYTRRNFLRSVGLCAAVAGISEVGNATGLKHILGFQQINPANAALAVTVQKRYYAHDAVLDQYGVIAPWYTKVNGQCDFRIRIAAETLKRYPWTTTETAVAAYPDYLFTSLWNISKEGVITSPKPSDWSNGDLGQRSTNVLKGMVEYYRYAGDPVAIAHMTYMADFLLDHCLTPENHIWPRFPISVPTKGKPYGDADPSGMIQTDISATMGLGVLKAYQVTGNQRWFEAAKHWGDLFAQNCNLDPGTPPWKRYVNPESVVKWKDHPKRDLQTGSVTMILSFLDELVRLGYEGENKNILKARKAGIRYLRDELLPKWTEDLTFGHFFWDTISDVQNCSTTSDVANYMIEHKELFPNWRNDTRNILSLFLNRTSVSVISNSDVFSGAWAYPESRGCCQRSLWYPPLMVGTIMMRYGVEAQDTWMRELGYRQMVLQTYDAHENGITEDLIDGGIRVNATWLNIAHPWPLFWVMNAVGWMPEELGASRESHLVRTSGVVNAIVYGKGKITYSTFDAPDETVDVLRLAFKPSEITADGNKLQLRNDLKKNGFVIKELPNGDAIVQIRHDGAKNISIEGLDEQAVTNSTTFEYEGNWTKEQDSFATNNAIHAASTKGATATIRFQGNQVRLIARADEFGGKADVYIDGIKQLVPIDCWNPIARHQQVLYYKNGLEQGEHTLKIVAQGSGNPYAKGNLVYIDAIQSSSANKIHSFPTGKGPTTAQRMIFGYPKRQDYIDRKGNAWRPATELVFRGGKGSDVVKECWWTSPSGKINGTSDSERYQYGFHAPEFWVNLTVGPEKYDAKLSFAATRNIDTSKNCFDVLINGQKVLNKIDIKATAGGADKAVDFVFKDIEPRNGIIEIRFQGINFSDPDPSKRGEAFVQALEIGHQLTDNGSVPVSGQG